MSATEIAADVRAILGGLNSRFRGLEPYERTLAMRTVANAVSAALIAELLAWRFMQPAESRFSSSRPGKRSFRQSSYTRTPDEICYQE